MEDKSKFITVTSGMSGYFAVMMWYNTETENCHFWEPYDTGFGRYNSYKAAEDEAKEWAEAEGLTYKPNN